MACADGIEQVLEFSGRGRLRLGPPPARERSRGVNQLRIARSAWGQLGVGAMS